MWEKFGGMETAADINELAANMRSEKDMDSIRALAKERGIDAQIADLFIAGNLEELCDAETAAVGKLTVEQADMKLKKPSIIDDWIDYIKAECMSGDSQFTEAVMKNDKTLKGSIGSILRWSFSNQNEIDSSILKAAGVTGARVTMGIPAAGQAKKIIRDYYLGRSGK